MPTLLDEGLIADTLQSLPGWQGGSAGLTRDVHLSPELDAELRRQIGVDAASMGHAPSIDAIEGGTRYTLRTADVDGVTELDIAFASHISDLAHRLSGSEPGILAVRDGDPVVTVRPGEAIDEHETPTIGVGSVTGGSTPATPLPDTAPHAPKPGPSTEQRPT